MANEIYEKEIYLLLKGNPTFQNLKTECGKELEFLELGKFNSELPGPDFKNAKIRIGKLVFEGDIEVDLRYTDWFSHGHAIDKKYESVVLQINFFNKEKQRNLYTLAGRKVYTINLRKYLSQEQLGFLQREKLFSDKFSIKCKYNNNILDEHDKIKYLSELGVLRFKRKMERFFHRIKELGYIRENLIKEPVINFELPEEYYNNSFQPEIIKDVAIWKQALYEFVFEALGYSNNKGQMLNLAKSAELSFFEKYASGNIKKIEAILFNIAGLASDVSSLPREEVSDYSIELYEIWKDIRDKYDGKIYDEVIWNFYRIRPANFPTIRIAAGARLIYNLINEDLFEKIEEIFSGNISYSKIMKELRKLIVIKSDGYWKSHYLFDQKVQKPSSYFVGHARADEIIINIIFPLFALYFEALGKREISKRVFKTYSNVDTKGNNKLVNDLKKNLGITGMENKAILLQGLIELFRSYCSKDKCLECSIGKIAFS